jgi:hypothetical protein
MYLKSPPLAPIVDPKKLNAPTNDIKIVIKKNFREAKLYFLKFLLLYKKYTAREDEYKITKSKTPLLVPFDNEESTGNRVIKMATNLVKVESLDQKNTVNGTIKILEKAIKKSKMLRILLPLISTKTLAIFSLYASPGNNTPLIADSNQKIGLIRSKIELTPLKLINELKIDNKRTK